MRAHILLCSLVAMMVHSLHADDQPAYDVGRISPAIRGDAPAVTREDLISFEIVSPGRAKETRKVAYTVFRSDRRDRGELEISYDRFIEIDDLDGALYDDHGMEIRTLSGNDIKDESDINAYSLYSDARIRRASLYYDRYPYTVEFTYTLLYNGLLNFPTWYAQPTADPVEHTKMEIIAPSGYHVRYWPQTDSLAPKTTTVDGETHLIWEASGLEELSTAEMEEDIEIRSPVVRVAPTTFELGGHAGAMADWAAFGKWVGDLYQGKGELPAGARHDVDSLINGVNSSKEKIARIYRYMQGKTRYVNVSLGIGGWEPYDASYVFQRGYGDCKALSNFTVSLLNYAGIKAYPAVIYAGGNRSRTLEGFPENRFNHVIVCIPEKPDSVWLECTSSVLPVGFLGDFTENRPALLLTPGGGTLVHTPASTPSRNAMIRTGTIELTSIGDARASFSMMMSGALAEDLRYSYTYDDPRRREQKLMAEFRMNGMHFGSATVRGVEEHAHEVSVDLDAALQRFGSLSGSRVFFLPDVERAFSVPPERALRRSPVRFKFPFMISDSLVYRLPAGFTPEALPGKTERVVSFGSFRSSTTTFGDSELVYVRTLIITEPVIPAERYDEYRSFMKDVANTMKTQAVIKKSK